MNNMGFTVIVGLRTILHYKNMTINNVNNSQRIQTMLHADNMVSNWISEYNNINLRLGNLQHN